MDTVTRVWVEDGCICCQACVGTLPEVFSFPDERAAIVAEVRVDAVTSYNDQERARLNAVGLEYQDEIREAAAGCPVDVIKFDAA